MNLSVEIKPNSHKASLEQLGGGSYKAYLKSPAVEGKANQELIEVLADHFGVAKSMVEIVSGLKSRRKRVNISSI
ncbi:MAG: DUF167 domain-containing protein [bacterium]|nr:DUF167 domain-containing protein [bacterium]